MRITLAQVPSELGDVEGNLARAGEIIARAGAEGSDLVVFPELYLTGYSLGLVDEDLSMWADDPRVTALSTIAPRTDVLVGLYDDGHGVHSYNAAAYVSGGELVHSPASSTCRHTTSTRSASTSRRASRCARSAPATDGWRR